MFMVSVSGFVVNGFMVGVMVMVYVVNSDGINGI